MGTFSNKLQKQISKEIVSISKKSRGYELIEIFKHGKTLQIGDTIYVNKSISKKAMESWLTEFGPIYDVSEDMYEQLWIGGLWPCFLYEVHVPGKVKLVIARKI